MAVSTQGLRETVRVDAALVRLWWTMVVLAWLSLVLVAGWGDWAAVFPGRAPILETAGRVGLLLGGSGLCWRGLRRRPVGLVAAGRLEWRAGRARFETATGERRGETEMVWRTVVLVGVRIRDPVAGPLTLWLTPRRLGEAGWWRLQRFLVLGAPEAG